MSNQAIPAHVKASRKRTTIAAVEAAAIAGDRCPTNDQLDYPLSDLAREGLFRVEVYAKNWRVATILTGEHAGKHTAMPPTQYTKPYLTIGAAGPAPERRPEVPTVQVVSDWTVDADGNLTRTNAGR